MVEILGCIFSALQIASDETPNSFSKTRYVTKCADTAIALRSDIDKVPT